jgi:hypothetical protein
MIVDAGFSAGQAHAGAEAAPGDVTRTERELVIHKRPPTRGPQVPATVTSAHRMGPVWASSGALHQRQASGGL